MYKDTEPNVTTVTIPYVKGTSETIARILQPYNIRVAHKPITTSTTDESKGQRRTDPADREQFTRSNAAITRPLILVRPAEI